MLMPFKKSGTSSALLGLAGATCMVLALAAHGQESGKSGAYGSEKSQSSGQSGTAGATSGGMKSSTESSQSSSAKLSKTDERLMMQLAQANIAEINAGKLAEQKSDNDQVKSFAKKMVDDHTKALDDLKQIAEAKGVTLPTEPDRQQQAMENKLSALSGTQFDRQYVNQSGNRAHRDTHRLLQKVSNTAMDADLKSYAGKTIATVESHQQLAKETSKELQSTSTGKSSSGMEKGGGTSGSESRSGNQ